ncbi:MAG: hypothetical protein QXX36_02940 [Candidatus Rehaiarchaeum fermentans]|nr:hypothetical protein [Candidatus Rehaiarchaeum fermentans]
MKDLVSCIVTYKPNIDHLKLLVDKLNKKDIYATIFDNIPINGLNSQIVNAERIISFGENMENETYPLIRRQHDLYYIKYMLVIILILYDKLRFLEHPKYYCKALYHGIIGNLEKDNENIIKNFKAN